MKDEKSYPQIIVDSFKELVLFMQKKWASAIFTTILLMIVAAFSVGLYVLYVNSSNIMKLLNSTHSTPETLQHGLVASVEDNLLIEKELLRVILNSHDGVAAIYYKFHDSKTDLQGKHDFFFSAMAEATKDPKISYLDISQNVPVVSLGQYMIPLFNGKCQTIPTEDIPPDNKMKKRLEDHNIIRITSCPIFDITDKYLLGFVELVYIKPNDMVSPIETVEADITAAATRISFIISK